MAGKSGDKEDWEIREKDSRRARKREEDERAHHISRQRKGPDVIIRSQLGGTRTSFEAEDAFDVSCDDVAHSLNKAKRWEKADNAEQIAYEQNSSGKISFAHASISVASDKRCVDTTVAEVAAAAIMGKKGGVKKYVEVEDGDISVRNAKSTRTSISSLQSNADPGPLLKANRHRDRRAKNATARAAAGESISDPEEQHVRYTAIDMKKSEPKAVERSWRSSQNQRASKQGWTRKHASDYEMDQDSDQDFLEDKLDELYEKQLDSEQPLRLPDNPGKKPIEKPCVKGVAEEMQEEEPITTENEKKLQRKQREKVERERLRVKMAEAEYRARCVELRTPLAHSQHLEVALINAKEYFSKMDVANCLPVFPRTVVIHKEDSDRILGTKMNNCTFVAASNAPGAGINLFSAPRFCCAAPLAAPVDGWQSHERSEPGKIMMGSLVAAPSPSLVECSLCEKSADTEEEDQGGTVLIKHPLLFSISCGHLACHSCWLEHVKQKARDRATAITCVNSLCDHIATSSEAAALFSDGTLELFRGFWWDAMCARQGAVHCHDCARLLIPLKATSAAITTAICVCGTRTCTRCARRDHLPITCIVYKKWTEQSSWYTSASDTYLDVYFYRKMRPSERPFLRNCKNCGAEEAVRWKNWCDKCAFMPNISIWAPVFSNEELVSILEARGRWIDAETQRNYRIRRGWRGYRPNRYAYIGPATTSLYNDEITRDMEKIIDEGVFLFENIKISRIRGVEPFLTERADKIIREKLELENNLDAVLFDAMVTGGDEAEGANAEEKEERLRKTIDAIRHNYSLFS